MVAIHSFHNENSKLNHFVFSSEMNAIHHLSQQIFIMKMHLFVSTSGNKDNNLFNSSFKEGLSPVNL